MISTDNFPQTCKGAFTALITPFNENMSIDTGALKALVQWQIENGIHGLVPAGTTGESPTLSHKEHYIVLKIVIEEAKGRVPVIAGTGSNSTHEAIELTRQALALGATASLQVAPYYNKPSQEGLYRHFSTIAEYVPLPQILYNIPGRTGVTIETETFKRLWKNPLIIGVKDATGNITQAMDIIKENKDFIVLSGDDNLALPIVALGGDGVISVLSNIKPAEITELIHAGLQQDLQKARNIHYSLLPFFKHAFIETNPIPIKYMASTLGLCEEYYRLPLVPLQEEHKKKIDTLMTTTKAHQATPNVQ